MKGSIVKRGNTYSIVFDMGKDLNGRRRQKWDGGYKTKREAQTALNCKIYEIQNQLYFESDKRTVAEYLTDWLGTYVEYNLAVNTIKGYRNIVDKQIIPSIGCIQISKLHPSTIQKFYDDKIKSGLSATSVVFIHRVLHKSLVQAVKLQLINRNVCDYISIPRKKPFEIKLLSENQIKTLLDACKGTYLYVAVLLAVSLGLRRGEVLGLKWDDIDFESNVVNICRTQVILKGKVIYAQTKTVKSKRSILISDRLVDLLKSYKNEQENYKDFFKDSYSMDNLVICHENGSPMSASTLNKQFKNRLRINGLPEIRFHDLRHTNATLMLKNKVPAKIASERLGHSSIGITLDLYSHVLNEMQKEASELMDFSII